MTNLTPNITRWQKALSACLLSCAALLPAMEASAQLSTNPDKFLGNITTRGSVESGGEKYHTLWNQITPENESKWSSIEGSRDRFNWGGCDNAYNYSVQHGFPFKFHTLVWGSQYPSWMDNLSATEQYKEIVEWMDAVKQRYPDLPMIDVVNEAVPGHAPAPYKAALGGDGKTGYDWIIKAFEMAYERWPDAILIYNDYNTFQWQKSQFIDLVKILRDAGAPVDAYGCQSHDLTDMNVTSFKSAMTEIQNALKMPMYSTEYDIGTTDDALQLQRYKEQIPYMWEADYCAGITLWGYIYGATWTTDGNSGIIRNGADRPAMTWLREYMQTDKAKNAKSPYPGMVKEASVYIKPASIAASKDEAMPITVRAKLKTKTIDHIDLYVKNKYYCTLTEAPYETTYTPTVLGRHDLKAIVVATDSSKYERMGGFTAYKPRTPYKGTMTTLPGTLQAENFDDGAEGIAFHDSDTKNEGTTSYRTGTGGVDIVNGNGGYAIGYTAAGEWLEYTVNVTKAGYYTYDAVVSSGATNSSISLSLRKGDDLTPLTEVLPVPCVTSGNWDNYRTLNGRLLVKLEAGEQVIRLNITGSSCNVDKVIFKHLMLDDAIQVNITSDPAPAIINEVTTLRVDATSPTSTIASVKLYVDDILLKTLTEAPFEADFKPTAKRLYQVTAVATDAEGYESLVATYALRANNKRSTFNGVIALPGTIEAENFDKGGEESTFHDKDDLDQGATGYRSDNEGLDIITTPSGGYAVGNTVPKEWMEYTVNVTDPGQYAYEATVSSTVAGSTFNIGLVNADGTITNLCKVTIPNTGSKNTYKVVTGNLGAHLQAGEQVLRFTINTALGNIDKVTLKCTQSTGIHAPTLGGTSAEAPLYTPAGVQVDYSYKGVVIRGGKKFYQK
ncbi:MAG: endo-1,4-beta-xylanase [Bacteroidaceae bacterium]|nr:endo-1,4-beta-xylanase [Bacteroidaceae bacterium]